MIGVVKRLVVCSDAAMSQPSTRPALYKGVVFHNSADMLRASHDISSGS